MALDNAYVRARIKCIQKNIDALPVERDKIGEVRTLLKQGFIPPEFYQQFNPEHTKEEDFIMVCEPLREHSNDPLSFAEIASFSSWFALHPGKVAGKEEATTSLHFPITIKGTKEDVVATLRKGMTVTAAAQSAPTNKKLLHAKAKAKAITIKMKMMKRSNHRGSTICTKAGFARS